MKKLHRLVISSYLGPFFVTFTIAMVFLIMQFLWKYVDDLMGKGLEFHVILELLFYASANLVPMALPLAILLSSIMTFGNLGESSELVAMRSAGLSLMKIMRPLILFILLVSFGAFFFANYLWPVANLKFRSLIFDIQQQKPALQLKEKIFFNDIPNYSIRVMEKNNDDNSFKEIIIYDHSNPSYNHKRDVFAESGNISQTEDGNFMLFHLNKGKIYEELDQGGYVKGKNYPFQKISFERATIAFDLSSFKLQRTDAEIFSDHYEMLNMNQLAVMEDSLRQKLNHRLQETGVNMYSRFLALRPITDSLLKDTEVNKGYSWWDTLAQDQKRIMAESALNFSRNAQDMMTGSIAEFQERMNHIDRHRLEWHRKLTLSFACLVLFFIGAPLGAIIRKGGIGAPIVVSTLLFILYYIISISGEKMAKAGVMDPSWGMWLSTLILFPVGFFLTYKSNKDARLFDTSSYLSIIRRKRKVKA